MLSGAANVARSRTAMQAVYDQLVQKDSALVQLLDPPFDQSNLDPGYIRGYVPGVRENGGQYTHAAIWAAMAFAKLGEHDRAWELLTMINPINHANSRPSADIYKVEPYVVAADVYAFAPHTGRGGWSWYTGSAGWMYRLMVESLLGLTLQGDELYFEPSFPKNWNTFTIDYRYRTATYHIIVSQTDQKNNVIVDGLEQSDKKIRLLDDGLAHQVSVNVQFISDTSDTSDVT